jgi:hypothetical protein
MYLVLTEDLFVNDRYTDAYGNREARFTIIDEEFPGNNQLGRINRITVLVRDMHPDGTAGDARFCTTVIGLGDGYVGVMSDLPELRGKLMTRYNMAQCVVELVEGE